MLYNVVLVSAIHQEESAIDTYGPSLWVGDTRSYMSTFLPPPIPAHLSKLSQSTGLSSLHHTTNFHWLSFLHMVMYIFQGYCLNSFHPLLPLLCPQVCSLCLCLHSFPENRFISIIFLDSIFVH